MSRATRKAKRAEAQRRANTLIPPEGVPLTLEVAGLGVRLGAQLTDIVLTFAGAIAFLISLSFANIVSPDALFGVAVLLFFMIRVPYYILTELIWNGQTLGKKFMKIKVVAHDGGPLSAHSIVVRNMMKEAEVLLPLTLVLTLSSGDTATQIAAYVWIAATLVVPALNVQRRRLGDFVAGTYVIHLPEPILLKDLTRVRDGTAQKAAAFSFLPHQLDHYGAYELQTLETLLRASEARTVQTAQDTATLATVVEKIRRKIGYAEAVPDTAHEAFLRAFYNAQRAYLEQRQIFGEKRADKHHTKA